MLRLAVVGAGIMGASHARIAASLREATLELVVDADVDRAARCAAATGARAASDLESAVGAVDAAIVAVPTELHVPVGLALIEAGVHLLIEKPIAPSPEDGERLVAAADAAGVTLMVGHVERFNPAVLELANLLHDVVHVSASRISPFSARVADSVVLDLMIHDLDLVRALVPSPIVEIHAVGRALRSGTADLACALLRLQNGATANLTASRIGQQKIRELRITQPDGFVTVDLVRQDVTINRVEHSEFLSAEGARYRQSGVVEIPFLEHRGEPLHLEQQEFVRAATTGTPPKVTGSDGVEAVRLAREVERLLDESPS